MADDANLNEAEPTPASRRDFVKTSAQVAVTAPAVAMLLSASTKRAYAVSNYEASARHILDDYTFGNNREDIDAAAFGNFNPLNSTLNLDDHVS